MFSANPACMPLQPHEKTRLLALAYALVGLLFDFESRHDRLPVMNVVLKAGLPDTYVLSELQRPRPEAKIVVFVRARCAPDSFRSF
jgi:hypothetical protein